MFFCKNFVTNLNIELLHTAIEKYFCVNNYRMMRFRKKDTQQCETAHLEGNHSA